MMFAGFFAGVLCLGLILGDWFYFMRLTPDAGRYGCGVARTYDRLAPITMKQLADRFDADGLLALPHGTARLYQDLNQIVIRQKYRLFAMGFRTLWPLKGLVSLSHEGDALAVLCRKLTPWSSALLTGLWFIRLRMVEALARAQGGDVAYAQAEGGGARVTVTLPG